MEIASDLLCQDRPIIFGLIMCRYIYQIKLYFRLIKMFNCKINVIYKLTRICILFIAFAFGYVPFIPTTITVTIVATIIIVMHAIL